MTVKDITGKRFGRLVALRGVYIKYKKTKWWCLCDCGEKKKILLDSLLRGKTTSCGCYRREVVSSNKRTHGFSNNNLYSRWLNMKNRCFNKNNLSYKNYGGRGITLCETWMDFNNFKDWSLSNGFKEGLTIDRIDNDKDYSPDNCRWVDRKVQVGNRRVTLKTTINGKEDTLSNHSETYKINYFTLVYRYNNGLRGHELIKRPNNASVSLDGNTRTLKEWSRVKGINYGTLQHRHNKGLRGKELFAEVDKKMSDMAKKSNLGRVD